MLVTEKQLRRFLRSNCAKEKRIHLLLSIFLPDKATLVTWTPLCSLPCKVDTGHRLRQAETPATSTSKLDPLHPLQQTALSLPSMMAAGASGQPCPCSSSWTAPGQGGCTMPGSPPSPAPPRASAGGFARITKIWEKSLGLHLTVLCFAGAGVQLYMAALGNSCICDSVKKIIFSICCKIKVKSIRNFFSL